MYVERAQSEKLREPTDFFPAVIVTGARQVGRSTMVEHTLTGSQHWGVLASVSVSLAGCAALLDLEGFSLTDLARHRPRTD